MGLTQDARALVRAGEVAEAIRLLRTEDSDPGSAALLREHYIGEGQVEQAMPCIERLASDHGPEAHTSRSIKALLSGDVNAAVSEAEQAVRMDAESATAHNQLGRALHNQGCSADAIQAFERAIQLDPDYPQAWYNLGHVQRAIGRLPESTESYEQALERAPAFRAARLNLGISYSVLEQPDRALACLKPLLEADPDDVEALVNAGLALHQLGRLDEAEAHLERALELDARHANAWCYLGVLRNERLDTEGALDALQQALQLNPADTEARVELAGALEQSNRLDEARTVVEEGMQRDPYHPALRLEAARLQRREGDIAEALRTLRSLNPAKLPPRLAQQAWFELGHALDRNGEWPEAYHAFEQGNRLAAQSPRRQQVDAEGFARRCEALEHWLAEGAPGIEPGPGELTGDTGADLVFLLGFPRSGTTLLDTFLNAHRGVRSVEERPTLEQLIEGIRQSGADYPAALADFDAGTVQALRHQYRSALKQHAGLEPSAGTIVLDKLPMRTLNVGLIQRLFPRARVLLALRHPCDVVLSNFMQSYADNEAFIHFDSLAESAAMYDRVMGLWLAYQPYLGLPTLETRYEDLVADSGAELDRVCGFLGIEATDEMLDVENRLAQRGRIRTNSYQQVAEPVYQRARGRWLNYREPFAAVMPTLRPYIGQFGYSDEAEDGGGSDG
ncbi:MAG: tetratricopeptide repeat protein [Xanthomonadales bacterium]|nr:tetratricopeptide repeat protein [Xanthomonadales bacterium]